MFYLFNAVNCAIWHIQKKHQKYIFMFTELKVVHTIKIGTHTGPLCHTENVPSWMFSWYWEKSRWKALSFFMINMIWIMRPLIWIFTKQHFYLIHGPFGQQKYGIAFSWPIRCHNMSCETSLVQVMALPEPVVTSHWWCFGIFTWGQFDRKCSRYLSLTWLKTTNLRLRVTSHKSQWVIQWLYVLKRFWWLRSIENFDIDIIFSLHRIDIMNDFLQMK